MHQVLLVPTQFSTLQAAVDAAQGPATIVVAPGAYDESVVVIDKESLVIQSACLSRRGVVLFGGGGESVVRVERSALSLSGLELRSNGRLRGIRADDAKLNLQECLVAGNRTGSTSGSAAASAGAGLACRRSSVHLQKSTIAGNTVDCAASGESPALGGGLFLEECSVEIAGSTVSANAAWSVVEARGGGLWCERVKMRIWRSRVTDNALRAPRCEGAGLYLRDPLGCELGGSVIAGNGAGEGRGGGLFVDGESSRVNVHRNSVVHLNYPDDRWPDDHWPQR